MFVCTSSEDEPPVAGCLCHTPQYRRVQERLNQAFSRRSFLTGSLAASAVLALRPGHASAASPDTPGKPILFRNAGVFDGTSSALRRGLDVLVEGNVISAIEPTGGTPPAEATVVDGGGRVLMPGLIDAHAHLTFNTIPFALLMSADPNYSQIHQAVSAGDLLMQGFTSVRDLGGPVFGLKRVIDEGSLPGPRIWPSGPMISQTSGHADFRALADLPARASPGPVSGVRLGYSAVADGVAEVHKLVREQLMQGASQIKLALGGGVSSNYDPIDVTEYTPEEVIAAVADAENWGTYVCVHVYTPRAIRQALDCGVKCIEHGQLVDEPTMELLVRKGVWFSTQPFLDDEDRIPTAPGSDNEKKYRQVAAGTDTAYKLAKKHGAKVAFGCDVQFNPNGIERQAYYLPKLARWYSPAELLKQATHDNAELLALSGPRNPYPGKLGVVEKDALADLILVEGDPLQNVDLLADPGKNFRVIMKDGKIHKNTLTQ